MRWQNTWESDSRRPRHLGLNVQMDGGRKMPAKNAANYPSPPPRSRPCTAATVLTVSVATEMSTDSSDELNQWHFHCRETTCRCVIQRRPQPEELRLAEPPRISAGTEPWALVDNNGHGTRPAQQKHRPPRKYCNCGVSMVFQRQDHGNRPLHYDRKSAT